MANRTAQTFLNLTDVTTTTTNYNANINKKKEITFMFDCTETLHHITEKSTTKYGILKGEQLYKNHFRY